MRRLIHIVCLGAMLAVFLAMSNASAQSASERSWSYLQSPKHGVARAEGGKEIGSVVDFIVDLPTGRILFAVVTPTITQDQQTPVLLLPWSLAWVDSTGSIFNFRMTANTVRHAPRLSAKMWKQPPRLRWLTAVERYWRTHTSILPFRDARTLGKATALIGVRVQGPSNTKLGTIRELVLDPTDSAIALVVLSRATTSTEESRVEFSSLPWEQLYVEPWGNTLIAVAGHKILT